MKTSLITILLFLIFCFPIIGQTNPFTSNEKELEELNDKKIIVTGIIEDLKYHIWSRDNFYTFKLTDAETNTFIFIRLYTINWLKRANYFDCEDGDSLRIKEVFHTRRYNDQIGYMNITEKLKIKECIQHLDEDEMDEINSHIEQYNDDN